MEQRVPLSKAELKIDLKVPFSYQSREIRYQGCTSDAVRIASCSLLLNRKSDKLFHRCRGNSIVQNLHKPSLERFAAADHALFSLNPRAGVTSRAALDPSSYGSSEIININGSQRTLEMSKIGELSKAGCKEEMGGGMTEKDKLLEQTLRGRFVKKDKRIYRQIFVIRSYEVGSSRMASVETLANFFQEISLNHASATFDSMGDAMGSSHTMMKHGLIWAITKLHIQIDCYPMLGDVIEIDTSTNWSSKNTIRRDNIVRDHESSHILCKSTSSMVVMSTNTRRISRIPDDLRNELSSYVFYTSFPKDEKFSRPLEKMNDDPLYIQRDLEPKLQDIDLNGHVNNVKYIQWILETIPENVHMAYELTSITMEFRKEISNSDVIMSMAHPCLLMTKSTSEKNECENPNLEQQNHSNCLPSQTLQFRSSEVLEFIHSLRRQSDGSEILRGKTCWRFKKNISMRNFLSSMTIHTH